MSVIRIHRRIDSETLHLPELRPLLGKTVEIVVRADEAPEDLLETRATFFGRMPPRPPASAEEKDEEQRRLRELARTNPAVAAALEVAAAGGPDVDAIIAQRARG